MVAYQIPHCILGLPRDANQRTPLQNNAAQEDSPKQQEILIIIAVKIRQRKTEGLAVSTYIAGLNLFKNSSSSTSNPTDICVCATVLATSCNL